MRNWNVDPSILCLKHLLGEHCECHMFLGTLKKKKRMDGYIKNDLFEPLSLKDRHDILANEMSKRGMNHNSPLDVAWEDLSYLTSEQIRHRINSLNSLNILLERCPECCANFSKGMKGEVFSQAQVEGTTPNGTGS